MFSVDCLTQNILHKLYHFHLHLHKLYHFHLHLHRDSYNYVVSTSLRCYYFIHQQYLCLSETPPTPPSTLSRSSGHLMPVAIAAVSRKGFGENMTRYAIDEGNCLQKLWFTPRLHSTTSPPLPSPLPLSPLPHLPQTTGCMIIEHTSLPRRVPIRVRFPLALAGTCGSR